MRISGEGSDQRGEKANLAGGGRPGAGAAWQVHPQFLRPGPGAGAELG
jgi:hypothetical protein